MTSIVKGANAGGWFLPVYLEDDAPDAPTETGKLLVYAQQDNQGGVSLLAINSDGEIFQLSTNNDLLSVIADGAKQQQEILEEMRVIRAALVHMATEDRRVSDGDLHAEAHIPLASLQH